jgi:hypothetical protein
LGVFCFFFLLSAEAFTPGLTSDCLTDVSFDVSKRKLAYKWLDLPLLTFNSACFGDHRIMAMFNDIQ